MNLIRSNILNLLPYRCARDDYSNGVLLDANENSFGSSLPNTLSLERYPSPYQIELKTQYAQFRNCLADNLFIGNGSDEAIDLIIRIFCIPGKDKILTCQPTYGMYKVCAQINDIQVLNVDLKNDFQLDVDSIINVLRSDNEIKLLFLCSPGNPTGTVLDLKDMEYLLSLDFNIVFVIDEAYIDFASTESTTFLINKHKNVIILQTLSKSFGLAGIRCGIAISNPEIINILNKVKAPYNINSCTSEIAVKATRSSEIAKMKQTCEVIIKARSETIERLKKIERVGEILGTNDANFVLFQVLNKDLVPCNQVAFSVYKKLAEENGVVVRFRGNDHGCLGCLRVTIGTPEDMIKFFDGFLNVLDMF